MNERISGTVVWFNNAKGYGFLRPEGQGKDVFVHFSAIENDGGYKSLKENQQVSFVIGQGPQGIQAESVKRVGGRV